MKQPSASIPAGETSTTPQPQPQVVRETLESLAVAFILALMFKAFIAEAFVIPTGSMAPTLMGAHKDVQCEECGYQYQCGASSEFNDTGSKTGALIFGTVCPLCRKPQILDLIDNRNHQTFSGDRILVSKLAYVFSKPERWNVFVFKHIEDARLNYIKRCIGRPSESIRIEGGDIHVGENDRFEIARKPPHVIESMLQPLADTDYPAKSLVAAGMPDAWQNDPKNGSSAWRVGMVEDRWTASIDGVADDAFPLLRYHHRVLDPLQWDAIETDQAFPKAIDANSYRLITDFTAYNASLSFGGRMTTIPTNYRDVAPLEKRRVQREGFMARGFTRPMENDGLHWTGDLCGEWTITTEPSTRALRLVLVKAGVEHRCDIDLTSGTATATLIYEGRNIIAFEDKTGGLIGKIEASTAVRAGGKHRLKFANVDDSLTLWIDGSPVTWGNEGRYAIVKALPTFTNTPKGSAENPLDTAPVAIGVQGGGCTISRAQVYRDIYYIAHSAGDYLTDYNNVLGFLKESAAGEVRSEYVKNRHNLTEKQYADASTPEALDRNALLSNVAAWAGSLMDLQRRSVTFDLGPDAYFPMGDNSSASADARSWREHHVPGRLLIGRAVLVFWPHYWNAPIPFLPNFKRMGLIR